MKARFLALAALVLGLASCTQDVDTVTPGGKGEVDFQLSVAAPELAQTRAGDAADKQQNALDSAFGAIDYLQGGTAGDALRTDWDDVNLRYTLEVYDVKEGVVGTTPVKDRMVIIVDEYEPVTFDLRLAPNRDYRFVVFADFVANDVHTNSRLHNADAQKDLGLRHYIGSTLANIEVINDGINDEIADAYFATLDVNVKNSKPEQIVLRRPYAKLRVIATDLAELNTNVEPAKLVVKYEDMHANQFNAITGEISGDYTTNEYTVNYQDLYKDVEKGGLAKHTYTAGYDAETAISAAGVERHTHMTLMADYILAVTEQEAIHFEISAYDKDGGLIKTTNFDTDIPVQRNHLTTVIGNVLTTATHIEISVDDNFAGNHYFNLWDGKAIVEPKKVDGVYEIYEASELAWLAAQVNGGTRAAGISFKGETFRLMKDIHLNGELWTAIGTTDCPFSGTFDGNNHKIEGLFVYETGKASAGLFGYCPSATIKNLTVLNAEVYGNFKAAVIVADAVCTKIENCHVDGAIVLSTPYEKDDANNVGAIAGYLAADGGTAWVKDCTVKNATITAYRKVGGVVGAANLAAEVTGNYIESTTITADQTAEYKEVKAADAGRIVGWAHANAVLSDNEYAGQNSTVANTLSVRVYVYVKDAAGINNNSSSAVVIPAGEYNFTEEVNSQSIQVREGEVTINANNNTINTGNPSQYGFVVENGATLVIDDANVVSGGGGLGAQTGGKLIFNGNSVYVDSSSTSGRYVISASGEGSVITINGGTFGWDPKDNQKRAYVNVGAGAKVIINGGTFGKASTRSGYTDGIMGAGETIIYGGTFGFDPTRWVAEGCTVKKDGANWVVMSPEVATAEELAARLQDNVKDINVVLTADIDLPISSLGTITGGSGEYKLGGESTETITIDLNGKTLNITTTYWSNLGAKNAEALFTIKNGTMTSSQATGTWNSYDLTFSNCDYLFEDVEFAKAVAFDNTGKEVTMNNVTIKETHDYYAMWITASGQTVNIDGLTVESAGRGIKIDEQYVDTPAKVTLNVKDANFTTKNKAAIMVKSVAGADIALENVNIANVKADTLNAVWVDEDAAAYADLVTVTGGLKKIEGEATVLNANGGTIALAAVNHGTIQAGELKDVTIEGAEGAVMIFKTTADTKLENVTLKNVEFEYTGATADCGIVIDANAQIDNLVVEGCTFVGTGAKAGRGISGLNNNASIKLNGCTFKDLGYPIYAWGSYKSLEIVGCTFDNIKSWAIMPQSGFDGDLTVTGNTFQNCLGGGLIKAGTLTAGHTFTFENNVITNCTIAGDHNWFQFNVSAGTAVISGNTKDGADWTPGVADGLK